MTLVILDRDGVINEDSDQFVKSIDEWRAIPGSIEAIARLSQAGFTVAVATNQSGLARGYFSQHDLNAMHEKMRSLVEAAGGELAGVFYCPHGPDDNCHCRKPKAGLIDAIEETFNCKAAGAFMVGDSLRDLQAGVIKGCKPLLVKTGKGLKTQQQLMDNPDASLATVEVFDNLDKASHYIIEYFS